MTFPLKSTSVMGKSLLKTSIPNDSGYFARVDGIVKGNIIKIYAPLTKLEIDEAEIDSIAFSNQEELKFLSLKKNQITKANLDLTGAVNLEHIDLSTNNMSSFDFRPYTQLKSINLSNNPAVGNILVEGCEALESIDLSHCDVSVFYPVQLPNLKILNFAHNALMELEIGNLYPALSSLNIDHNDIERIDVTACKELNQLSCDNNSLESLDVSFNLKLSQLSCANNKLKALNVSHNTKLTGLNCANNDGIRTLDISNLGMLTQLSCDHNKIDYLDLRKAIYLKRLTAAGNALTFLDFDGNYALQYVDIRDNKNMSACAINFMFMTLPPHNGKTYYDNLLIKGCEGAETSNPAKIVAQDEDQPWQLDVAGNASAQCGLVPITIAKSQHGTAKYTQSTNEFGQNYEPITEQAYLGRVIKAEVKADEGYVFKGIKINDQLFPYEQFVVNESGATVEALFELSTMMTLKAEIGHDMSLAFAVPEGSEGLTIDWGDGQKMQYKVVSEGLTRIEHKAIGETITIEGDVKAAMFDSYPGTGTFENDLRGISIQNQPKMERLELFMNNNIRNIDLSGCPNLRVLNCEYTGISNLDVSHLTKLDTLMFDENNIKSIDLSKNTNLGFISMAGNGMTACELNDFYFLLPKHTPIPNFHLNFDLIVKESESNKHNDAQKAASLIAMLKGWKVNEAGDGTGCDESYVQIEKSENGTITIGDKKGNPVNSGDKVKNNTVLVIKATPADGHILEKVNANGQLVNNLDEYVVNGYTVFKAFFKVDTSVETPEDAAAFTVAGKTILVDKAEQVDLYNIAGYRVYSAQKMDSYQIDVEEGAYILKITNNGKVNAYKVIVK